MDHPFLVFLFVVLFDWIVFMAAARFAQSLMGVELPPGGSMAWKVALVAVAAGVVSVGFGLLVGIVLGLVAGVLVFWAIMLKAFDVGAAPLLGAVLLTKVVSYGLLTAIMGWLYPGASAVS